MKIVELKLENFRGFRTLNIHFQNEVNVLVGVNGAGKSSVLDAIAILLSWFTARLRGSTTISGRHFTDDDIHNGTGEAVATITISTDKKETAWKLAKGIKGRSRKSESDLTQLNAMTREFQAFLENNPEANLPVLVYYPVSRAVLDIPLRIRPSQSFSNQFAAFDDSLTSGADFRTFFEWFRDREDFENENFRINPGSEVDKQLEAVRQAITEITKFDDLGVRRKPLRMELRKRNTYLKVNQLSDGEKCLLAMVGDLARRLALANPSLEKPLEGNGVVLIDEIDLHLHPSWQRQIIPGLQRVFPNCQFIITTHSPQVLSHVKADNVFLLLETEEGIEVGQPEDSYGLSIDRISRELMGVDVRPEEISNALSRLFLLIDQNSLDEAKKLIMELRFKMGDDPELIKAEVLVRRKEYMGK